MVQIHVPLIRRLSRAQNGFLQTYADFSQIFDGFSQTCADFPQTFADSRRLACLSYADSEIICPYMASGRHSGYGLCVFSCGVSGTHPGYGILVFSCGVSGTHSGYGIRIFVVYGIG